MRYAIFPCWYHLSNPYNKHWGITNSVFTPSLETPWGIFTVIFPYPSGFLRWHCGNLTIAPVPAKQPWWIWINISCEFIINDCITTTKQSTTKPCASFLGYTVYWIWCKFDYIVMYIMECSALLFDNKGNRSMSDADFSICLIKPGIGNLRYCLI